MAEDSLGGVERRERPPKNQSNLVSARPASLDWHQYLQCALKKGLYLTSNTLNVELIWLFFCVSGEFDLKLSQVEVTVHRPPLIPPGVCVRARVCDDLSGAGSTGGISSHSRGRLTRWAARLSCK